LANKPVNRSDKPNRVTNKPVNRSDKANRATNKPLHRSDKLVDRANNFVSHSDKPTRQPHKPTSLVDLVKLNELLAKEREFVRTQILPKKKMLGRRLLTHLVFADCEAIIYYLKGCINADYESEMYEGSIDLGEWLASLAEDYLFDDDGNYFFREKKTRTLPHLLFVLKYAAKYLGKDFDPKRIEQWEHVKSAFKIRARITHPTAPTAIKVSDDDLAHIEALEKWLQACVRKLV
jgi:hypothetical protein